MNVFSLFVAAQTNSDDDLYNFSNSYNYSGYLVKTKQYKLAVPELERIYFMNPGYDTVKYLLIESYRKSGDNERGIARVREIFPDETTIGQAVALEYSRMLIQAKKFEGVKLFAENNRNLRTEDKFFVALNCELLRMNWKEAERLFDSQPQEIKNLFPSYHKLLERSSSVKYKNPFLAAGMSAIIPGAGKLYTKNWKDALIALVAVGSSAFQSYRGFSKKGINSAYGWIFGTLAIGFYTGNIYGSHKAAEIYNSGIDNQLYIQAEENFHNGY